MRGDVVQDGDDYNRGALVGEEMGMGMIGRGVLKALQDLVLLRDCVDMELSSHGT